MIPRTGDVLHIGRAASVQFIEPILFRVIRVLNWPTYDRWIWLDGYELDTRGEAVRRRSIFVQTAGLRPVQLKPRPAPRPAPNSGGRWSQVRPVPPTNQVGRMA